MGAKLSGKGLRKRGKGWRQGGGAMMGVGRVVGKGVGRGFNSSFQQNRYRYIEFGYRHAHYEMKSTENRDFEGVSPILAGNPHVMT